MLACQLISSGSGFQIGLDFASVSASETTQAQGLGSCLMKLQKYIIVKKKNVGSFILLMGTVHTVLSLCELVIVALSPVLASMTMYYMFIPKYMSLSLGKLG